MVILNGMQIQEQIASKEQVVAVCDRICYIRADDAKIQRARFTEMRKKLLLKEGKITEEFLEEVWSIMVYTTKQ